MLLRLDNAPVCTAHVAVAETNCDIELIPYPFYLPDLAPSDFFPFPKFKSHLWGRHFGNNEEVICDVEEFLVDQDATFFGDGVAKLENHWTKCTDVKGDMINSKTQSCLSNSFWVRLRTFWKNLVYKKN